MEGLGDRFWLPLRLPNVHEGGRGMIAKWRENVQEFRPDGRKGRNKVWSVSDFRNGRDELPLVRVSSSQGFASISLGRAGGSSLPTVAMG